jgi:hypothetical protein
MKKKGLHITGINSKKPMNFKGLSDLLMNWIKYIFPFGMRCDAKVMYRYVTILLVFFSLLAVPVIQTLVSMNENSVELIPSDGAIDFDTKEKYEKENQDEKIEFQDSRSNDHDPEASNLLNNFSVQRFLSHFKKDIPIPPPELS